MIKVQYFQLGSNTRHTCESKLVTNYSGISVIPDIITHPAPLPIDTYLHTTNGPIRESHIMMEAAYRKSEWLFHFVFGLLKCGMKFKKMCD
jgi:hypothetical protein